MGLVELLEYIRSTVQIRHKQRHLQVLHRLCKWKRHRIRYPWWRMGCQQAGRPVPDSSWNQFTGTCKLCQKQKRGHCSLGRLLCHGSWHGACLQALFRDGHKRFQGGFHGQRWSENRWFLLQNGWNSCKIPSFHWLPRCLQTDRYVPHISKRTQLWRSVGIRTGKMDTWS